MKRFIDIGTQTGNTEEKEFCFFDTVRDEFEMFNGECCFTSEKEFLEYYKGKDPNRYTSLIMGDFKNDTK